MSEYVKIRKQILIDIADVIRAHKRTNKLYKPSEFSALIKKLFVLPSGEAKSTIGNLNFKNRCIGILPTIYAATAISTITGMSFVSTVEGSIVEETETTTIEE